MKIKTDVRIRNRANQGCFGFQGPFCQIGSHLFSEVSHTADTALHSVSITVTWHWEELCPVYSVQLCRPGFDSYPDVGLIICLVSIHGEPATKNSQNPSTNEHFSWGCMLHL